MTALGLALITAGIVLIWAGLTDADVLAELQGIFRR